MSKILEYAFNYLQRGWQPLPIPHRSKNPNLKGWQNLILSAPDLPQYFNDKPQNIGVLLGSKSNGLTDVDLDSSEAVGLSLVCGKPFPPITDSGRKMRVVIIDSEDTLVYLRSDISSLSQQKKI